MTKEPFFKTFARASHKKILSHVENYVNPVRKLGPAPLENFSNGVKDFKPHPRYTFLPRPKGGAFFLTG